MYTFINNTELHDFFVRFYLTGKPTAAICHGTCILLKTKLPDGRYLVAGKRWTGFASAEEQYADNYVGQKIQPFRIEDEARKMPNSRFEVGAPFSAYAVRDGNLITGQQQNSGEAAARLVVAALEEDRKRYPTYVLVHGAFADESAWSLVRNELAVKANVVVVNLPAHGIDLTPASQVSLGSYVKSVVEVIEGQIGKVVLVGHSMAGMIISQVAELIPGKLDKLIYVSAYVPASGESMMKLAGKDGQSKVGPALEISPDQTTATIRKEAIPDAICADCPGYMKEVLVKYHKAEPTKPMGESVQLTASRFGRVPKYYIHTTRDATVGYALQQQMVKTNGTFTKTYAMHTAHLPFVTDPGRFTQIIREINEAK